MKLRKIAIQTEYRFLELRMFFEILRNDLFLNNCD